MSELSEFQRQIFEDKNIFDYSFIEIGKLFLYKLFTIDVYKSNFQTIRNEYIKSSENNNIEENELEFYKYICFEYLYLEKEPKKVLFNLYKKVLEDLEEIEKNILYINSEIEKLKNKKQNKDLKYRLEDRYYCRQLNFYKEKNKIAKDEIIDFLVNKIKSYAISKSKRELFSSFSLNFLVGKMPYRFSKLQVLHSLGNKYDIKDLTPISNKFLDLPARVYPEIKDLYISNKKDFFEFAKIYVSDGINDYESVIITIMNAVNKNHILNRRKDILETIFKHYKNEDYISIVSMLPLQIEGIFHDISIELGISESQSNKTAINKLLEVINEKSQSFYYFEYYSFIFPITRNKVAHGELIEDNLEHTAIMLILDLLPVCQFATSDDIKINKVLQLMKSIEENEEEAKLLEFTNYLDVEIPKFYDNFIRKENILEKYSEDKFWEYINEEIIKEGNENINNTKMIQYVKLLMSKKIASDKCKDFFKNISQLQNEIKKKKEKSKEFFNVPNKSLFS